MLGRLSRFDAHVKATSSVQVKTASGATVSIVAGVAILLLIVSEWVHFRTVTTRNHMYVDPAATSQTIPININVTFPELPCADVNVKIEDPRKDVAEKQAEKLARRPHLAAYKKAADTTA